MRCRSLSGLECPVDIVVRMNWVEWVEMKGRKNILLCRFPWQRSRPVSLSRHHRLGLGLRLAPSLGRD